MKFNLFRIVLTVVSIIFHMSVVIAETVTTVISNKSEIIKLDQSIRQNPQYIYSRDDDGRTPLQLAILKNDLTAVRMLIQAKSDANVQDYYGNSSLHLLAGIDDDQIFNIVIPFIKDINIRNNAGETPVLSAVRKGNHKIVKLLIEKGAKLSISDDDGNSPLHFAGDNDMAELLCVNHANIEARNEDGETPLMIAISRGRKSMVEFYFEKGAKIDTVNIRGESLLHYAVAYDRKEIVTTLLNKGADLKCKSYGGYTPLYKACYLGKASMVDYLIKAGAGLNEYDDKQRTYLFAAVNGGSIQIIKYLLSKGMLINAKDNEGNNLLHQAVKANDLQCVNYLLEQKIDANSKNIYQQTPLHLAVMVDEYNSKIIQVLIKYGANIDTKDNDGRTPVTIAQSKNDEILLELIKTKSK